MEILLGLFIVFYIIACIDKVHKTIKPKKKRANKQKQKNTKSIPIIDATREMNRIINYLINNYETICTYKEIYQINKEDRLSLLKWIWKQWAYRITKKKIKEKFPNYNIDTIQRIQIIESNRVNMLYKQQEFINMWADSNIKPLSWIHYYDFMHHQYLCKLEDIPKVFDYVISHWEDDEDTTPDFLVAPKDIFLEDCQYDILFIWDKDNFIPLTPTQFKEYCKKCKCACPFRIK